MILDNNNRPAKVPYPIEVNLYSSNRTVLSVQSSVIVDIEKWYVLAAIKSSYNYTGQVTLYASAQNIKTVSTVVNVIKSVGAPFSLKSYTIGQYLPADEKNYTSLMIQFLNRTGYPCKMNKTTSLAVFSSYVDMLDTPTSIDIPKNTSQYYVWSIPKLPGSVKVTVIIPNYFGSESTVQVYAQILSSTNVIVPPIPAGGNVVGCITFSGGGEPASFQEDTAITLSSSNTKISQVQASTLIPKKNYFTTFLITGNMPGDFLLSASGAGIPSASVSLTVNEVRPSTLFVSGIRPLFGTQFPMAVQIISSAGPPSVIDEAVTINIDSSNTSSVQVPSTIQLRAEGNEVLFLAKCNAPSTSTVIVSSAMFLSSSIDVKPMVYKAGLQLNVGKVYVVGTNALVQAYLTMGNAPIKGIEVSWDGFWLQSKSSTSDSNGTAQNTLAVHAGNNLIQASAYILGAGFVSNKIYVLGLRLYSVNVFSDIKTAIDISPSALNNVYSENTTVTLTAPSSVPVDGLLGELGARYIFKEWSGSCIAGCILSSTTNPLAVSMFGDQQNLSFKANYVSDYSMVYIIAIVIVIVVIVIALLLFRLFRGSKKAKAIVVEGEETEAPFLSQLRRAEAAARKQAAEEAKGESKEETKTDTTKESSESKDVKEFQAEEKKDDSAKEKK
jgi:hypothetical protein